MHWRLMFTATLLAIKTLCADPLMWKSDGLAVRRADALTGFTAEATRSDGYVLVCWAGTRDGARAIYGQLLSPEGIPQWRSDGLILGQGSVGGADWPVATAVEDGWVVGWLAAADDNMTGYWSDPRAQKFDDAGRRLWGSGELTGVLIDGHPSYVYEASLRVVNDGSGGGIFAWSDARRGDSGDLFVQHVTTDGSIAWANADTVTYITGEQYMEDAISDGAGNMILCWSDGRLSQDRNIFAAKVLADGTTPWGENGAPVCMATGRQSQSRLCEDGSGGAILAWKDSRNGHEDIYAQRLDANGISLWQQNGVPVSTAAESQTSLRVAASMNGGESDGAICVWEDYRVNGIIGEVFAQKVRTDGTVAWTGNGVQVCGDAEPDGTGSSRWIPQVESDRSGGAVFVWNDQRDGDYYLESDFFAARLNESGEFIWGGDCGKRVFPKDAILQGPRIRVAGENVLVVGSGQRGLTSGLLAQFLSVTDGQFMIEEPLSLVPDGIRGGANSHQLIAMDNGRVGVVWVDSRPDVYGTLLFYQFLDTGGRPRFADGGVPLFPEDSDGGWYQQYPRVTNDGAGGFHVVYEDLRTGARTIRYGHVSSSGELLTSPAGLVVTPSQSNLDQGWPRCASDGNGGSFVAWSEYSETFVLDVYVQRLNSLGLPLWQQPVVLSRDGEYDDVVYEVVSSSRGSCIVAWQSGTFEEFRISAARILDYGEVDWDIDIGDVSGYFEDVAVISDRLGGVYLSWSDNRVAVRRKDIYAQHIDGNGIELWTENGMLISSAEEDQSDPVLCLDDAGNLVVVWEDFRSHNDLDLYAQRISLSGQLTWPLEGLPVCVMNGDQSRAQVVSISPDNFYIVWDDRRSSSIALYGIHLNEAGEIVENNYWQEDGSAICAAQGIQWDPRAISDGAEGILCVWVDMRGSAAKDLVETLYAQRIYDNPLGVEKNARSLPAEFRLSQNHPNPFNAMTELRFSLPHKMHAELVIYDLTGRVVERLLDRMLESGEHTVKFDAARSASGIYFYRLRAGDYSAAQKMVLLK